MMAAGRFRKHLEKTMETMTPELSPLTIKIKGQNKQLEDSGNLKTFIHTERVAAGHRVFIKNGRHKSGLRVHVLVYLIEMGQVLYVSPRMRSYFKRYQAYIQKTHLTIPRRPFWSRAIQNFKVIGVDITYSRYSISFLEK